MTIRNKLEWFVHTVIEIKINLANMTSKNVFILSMGGQITNGSFIASVWVNHTQILPPVASNNLCLNDWGVYVDWNGIR